ncbi:uncharacterized protein [Lolium perenne]|uniref:uncharacterized protein n=1 Tax=Lolium perenne TaxID=4522 RepID=UPI003A99CBCF
MEVMQGHTILVEVMQRHTILSEPQGPGNDTIFAELIEEAKRAASDGGTMSRFSLTVKLLQAKSYYRISNVAFNAILLILALQYPTSSIPKSYEEALSIIGRLGLGYDSIHVCPNNYVLFRKDYAKENNCPKCKASRWKDADGRRHIPEKVLRHFPLIPRLQRMFLSKQQSKEVQNIRLGLATDGFNPYGNMSNSYSMWPVFVVPYNLPPWACMDQSNFMLTLLIPGPSSPGKDFDVFMEPLMEELQELWKGVKSYDANSPDKFDLRVAILWCIHDYPALHTLSGRATSGYQACVRCDKENCSKKLRNKIFFIGHRRWLPRYHPWRNSEEFNGASESRDKPAEFTPDELKEQLDRVRDVIPGKTKDTVNSRIDLEDMGIRGDLHLQPAPDDEDSFEMPQAWYTMSKQEKIAFCEFIKAVRFPDGLEGSIAEAYIVDECLAFCSRYFDDVETRFNRPSRNPERDDSHIGDVSIFKHGVKFIGSSQYVHAGEDYDKMVCLCKHELNQRGGQINVDRWLAKNFARWFQTHIGKMRNDVSPDLYALACKPDFRGPGVAGLSYQDEDSRQVPVQEKEGTAQSRTRSDQGRVLLAKAIVDKLKKRSKEIVPEEIEEVDQTMYQYCSDDDDDDDDDDGGNRTRNRPVLEEDE